MFLGSRARPVRRADNFTAICEQLSRQCDILNISQFHRPSRLVMGMALLLLLPFAHGLDSEAEPLHVAQSGECMGLCISSPICFHGLHYCC
jgi:hypothetical protein